MKQIKDFIKNNNLSFKDSGSGLNSECTIISGYALSLGIKDSEDIYPYINELPGVNMEYVSELDRVFSYAKMKNYGDFWKKEETKKSFVF